MPRRLASSYVTAIMFWSGILAGCAFLQPARGSEGQAPPAEADSRPAVVEPSQPEGQIAFTRERDGSTDIYLMDADGSDLVNLSRHPGQDYSPSWSPEGERIAFLSDRTGKSEVFVMDASGENTLQLTDDPQGAWWGAPLRWAPDGSRLLAVRAFTFNDNWTRSEVYVIEADGSGWRPVYLGQLMAHNDFDPEWVGPDQVGFRGFRYTATALYSVLVGNGVPQAVFVRASEPVLAFAPSSVGNLVALVTWSQRMGERQFEYEARLRLLDRENGVERAAPDVSGLDSMGEFALTLSPQGERIAFPATQLRGRRELWVWFLDCPTDLDLCLVPQTELGRVRGFPGWSPDGKWLVFSSEAGGDEEIYRVQVPEFWSPTAALKEPVRMTTSDGRDYEPTWRP
ncbi:MAG TPA: hypothetical protein VGA32_07320 [Anaerolineales bacterium]